MSVSREAEQSKRPYYDKGGHWLRGEYARARRALQRIMPDAYSRRLQQAQLVPAEAAWSRRRFMLRTPNSGRQ